MAFKEKNENCLNEKSDKDNFADIVSNIGQKISFLQVLREIHVCLIRDRCGIAYMLHAAEKQHVFFIKTSAISMRYKFCDAISTG